ncbi:hypothetical protein THAOC_31032 [Thalassiosira oceanica]|uniref:Non-structural maintenance of chromosomes element 4 n=1 Tax=Thalassiosira oceanica TaxID=159749 RepID=K0RA50_THAOC|nr:hypothetical protein THAOC_31032 [Thalassiosira oceanica]|eukprot:EJK50040.1 hypothetical protein THAOC_31032 [Thalassiosira oceanica]
MSANDDTPPAGSGRGRPRRRTMLMTLSGQTHQERQQLRRDFTALQQLIKSSPLQSDIRPQQLRNNELNESVRYIREAKKDASNSSLLAERSALQAENMITVPRYDAVRLAQMASKKGAVLQTPGDRRDYRFDWQGLGLQAGVCFSSLPTGVSFPNGPIEVGYTPRKSAERKRRYQEDTDEEDVVEEKVESVEQKNSSAADRDHRDHLSLVNTHLRRMDKKLHQSPDERDGAAFLFDPNSFTKTVENMSNFSHLIKQVEKYETLPDGQKVMRVEERAGIRILSLDQARETGLPPGPVVYPVTKTLRTDEELEEAGSIEPTKTSVLRLDYKQWKRMAEVLRGGDGSEASAQRKRRKVQHQQSPSLETIDVELCSDPPSPRNREKLSPVEDPPRAVTQSQSPTHQRKRPSKKRRVVSPPEKASVDSSTLQRDYSAMKTVLSRYSTKSLERVISTDDMKKLSMVKMSHKLEDLRESYRRELSRLLQTLIDAVKSIPTDQRQERSRLDNHSFESSRKAPEAPESICSDGFLDVGRDAEFKEARIQAQRDKKEIDYLKAEVERLRKSQSNKTEKEI